MLEEHHSELIGHNNVERMHRLVESPAASALMSGTMPPVTGPTSRAMDPPRHTGSPAQHAGPQYRPAVEELFSQLQSQLQIHSTILEEQRHHIERLDSAVGRLQQEQHHIVTAIQDVKAEVAARRGAPAEAPDSHEIDLLTEQLRNVTAKVNEVDSLKLDLNIMRRQMRRLERHASPAPGGLSSAEPTHDYAPHPPQAPPPPPPPPPPPSQSHAQSAPTAFSTSTPSAAPESRSVLYQSSSENRLPPPILPSPESRDINASSEPRTLPGFRSIDPSSSGSTVSGWRSAGSYAPGSSTLAPPGGPAPTSTPQSESPAVSGWAAVNANAAPKRTIPADGHAATFEAGQPGSPKRQRLAPLMPRVSYGEQQSTRAASPYQASEATPNSLPPVPSLANSRNPSNESGGSLPPPSNSLRFVLSNQEASAEESWRQESQRQAASEASRSGRGSPRRGRGAGNGGTRGRGRKSAGTEELGTPEWEQAEWSSAQVAPSGYYQPGPSAVHMQDQGAQARGNLIRRGGGHIGGLPDRHMAPGPPHHPGMPPSAEMRPHQQPQQQQAPPPPPQLQQQQQQLPHHQHQQQLPQSSLYPDPHFMPITTTADVAASGGSSAAQISSNPNTPGQATKKTRTKPIRNADGVLIRKDGRPDMRSVSSAMNLKKVHAKKEAERQSKEASEDIGGGSGSGSGHKPRDSSSANGHRGDTPRSNSEHDHPDGVRSPGTPSHAHRHQHDNDIDGDEDDSMDDESDEEELEAAATGDGDERSRGCAQPQPQQVQQQTPQQQQNHAPPHHSHQHSHASSTHSHTPLTPASSHGHLAGPEDEEKHAANMRKIFPYGIEDPHAPPRHLPPPPPPAAASSTTSFRAAGGAASPPRAGGGVKAEDDNSILSSRSVTVDGVKAIASRETGPAAAGPAGTSASSSFLPMPPSAAPPAANMTGHAQSPEQQQQQGRRDVEMAD